MLSTSRTTTEPPPPRCFGELEALVEALRPALVRLFRAYGISADDASDVVQDAIVCYLRKQDEVEDRRSWFLGAVRQICRNIRRTERQGLYQAVDAALLELVASPDDQALEKRALLGSVARHIARLGEKCRRILYLRYQLGCDRFEIADRLSCQASSVGTLEKRCIAALSERVFQGRRAPASGDRPASPGARGARHGVHV